MTKKQLIEALADVPDDVGVYIKTAWDDAWTPAVRKFSRGHVAGTVDVILLWPNGGHQSTNYLTEVK
jgi:hypothetical protein